MSETELKLQLTPDALTRLEQADLLADCGAAVDLLAVYFDSPKRVLAANGVSLRIRDEGGNRVQTTKQSVGGAVGLYARGEWEKLVEGDMPLLDDVTPVRAILGNEPLARMFEVAVTRKTCIVEHDGAQIEIALDRGEVRAAGRNAPICECELELKSGKPDALFSLAHTIADLVNVKPSVLSKAERGYQLLDPAQHSVSASGIAVDHAKDAADAFRRIAFSCLRHFRLNEDLLLHTRGAEALHQSRVALRRLRSAFSIFKPMLGDAAKPLAAELRWLASELGPARDLDVILPRAEGGGLEAKLRHAREDAHDRAAQALQSARTAHLMLDLVEWLDFGDWSRNPETAALRTQPVAEFAATALARLRRKVKKDGKGMRKLADDARHEVRKDAKKLRYAADFFEPLFEDRKAFTKSLKALQEQLGLLNDIATAPDLLRDLDIADHPDAPDLVAHGNKKPLLRDAEKAYDALVEARRFWK